MEQQHQFPQTTQQQPQNQTRAEAERLLGVAEKLLNNRDLTGSREFALLAQETDPVLEGSEQILAITDVLLASESRVNNNRHHDWYSILQSQKRAEPDLLRKNYRRLALLLHPDKNNYPLSDSAFKLVADAWSVLSDATKRTPYDHELSLYSKVDLRHQHHNHNPADKDKLPVRRSARADGTAAGSNVSAPPHFANRNPNPNFNANANVNVNANANVDGDGGNFWTACPYCYVIYEYPRVYKEYCIRCQNCDRAFHATALPSLPPMVPGKEAYYCCWGFFPIGFSLEGSDKGKPNINDGDNNVTAANAGTVPNNVTSAGNVNIVSGLSAAGAGSVPNNGNGNGNGNGGNNNNPNMGFPNWMPGMFNTPGGDGAATTPQNHGANVNVNNVPSGNMNAAGVGVSGGGGGGGVSVDFSGGSGTAPGFGNAMQGITGQGAKKRGRPRKNPLGL